MADESSTVSVRDPAAVPAALVLVLSTAGTPVRTVSLPARGVISIGRSSESDIVVDDTSLSRRHASLRLPELTVIDHASRNGTWVGEARVASEVETPVALGKPLRFGSVGAVIVRLGAALEAAQVSISEPAPGAAMQAVYELAERVARSTASVLIQGETGVGKEVLAERIHRSSPRAAAQLVKVNCAAFAPGLFESQMFGHERGAFTGAIGQQVGWIEAADGGTLFLDEVAELPLELQAKLLRVLEDRTVVRVGAVRGTTVDVRFVSASNERLAQAVETGTFRGDLYYRLAAFTLEIPPLRARVDEIDGLVARFARRYAVEAGVPAPVPSEAARERLRSYAWPGNIRQLRNVIERAAILCDGPTIEVEHLQFDEPAAPAVAPPTVIAGELDADNPEHLTAALALCAGNQTRAARMLGISRNTLLARLDRFDLPRPRKRYDPGDG